MIIEGRKINKQKVRITPFRKKPYFKQQIFLLVWHLMLLVQKAFQFLAQLAQQWQVSFQFPQLDLILSVPLSNQLNLAEEQVEVPV